MDNFLRVQILKSIYNLKQIGCHFGQRERTTESIQSFGDNRSGPFFLLLRLRGGNLILDGPSFAQFHENMQLQTSAISLLFTVKVLHNVWVLQSDENTNLGNNSRKGVGLFARRVADANCLYGCNPARKSHVSFKNIPERTLTKSLTFAPWTVNVTP